MAKKKRRTTKKRVEPKRKVSSKKKGKREKEEMDRAQVWSVDVLLAVVIFVAVILIFYTTMTARQKTELKDLESEAENMRIELEKNHELSFIVGDEIDESKLQAFIRNATSNYTLLKQRLGIRGDFCIFYEDADGNLIIIDNKTGIGNPNIIVGGYPCGVNIT